MCTSEENRNSTKLRAALLADEWAVRFNAGLDLVKLGHVDGIPALIEGLGHQSRAVRNFHAGTALVSLGDKAIPALSAALESNNIRVRAAAANILQQIDSAGADEFLSVAIDVLDSDDSEAKSDVYALLGRMGEGAYRVVPRLTATLRKPVVLHDPQAWEEDPRHPMTVVLAGISKPFDQTTAALVESLGSADESLRWSSVQALGQMGEKARPAFKDLRAVAQNELEDETVRIEAAYAIAKVGDEADIAQALTALLQSNSWWVRAFAARVIGEPALRSGGDSNGVVEWSPQFLEVALPPLTEAVADQDFNVRRNAALALSHIGAAAESAIPALTASLENDATGPVAAEALVKIGHASVPTLVESLDHPEIRVRGLAAYALKLINTPQAMELVKDAERKGRILPFQPRVVENLLPQVDVVYDEAKLQAFESLYERTIASGQGSEIEYDLSYPKHEFLRFLVEFKGLLMHGSNNADIDVMNPVRFSTDAGAPGNVSGVYAAKDHLQPMFFAIVNRRRCFGLTNGFMDRKEDGTFTVGEEEVGVHSRFYFLSIDYKGLLRDPWCSGTVYILPPETFTFWGGQYTSRVPVKPLMKIAIHPEDHPLLSEIWGYEYHGTMRSMVHRDDNDPYHFLSDVDIFPIHPSGKPFSVWLP